MTDFERILITGGAGFIGSHLSETLLEHGKKVTLIDDLTTGRWSNIHHLDKNPDFRVIIASTDDDQLVYKEVEQHDIVYHLASAVGVKLIIDQPVKTVETNFRTTDVVLSACSRYRRHFLITSTSEVYGKSTQEQFQEDQDIVMGPTAKRRWSYACSKALDEFLALAHFYETELPVFIARLFNTVGPRQTGQYGMVLPRFIQQALRNEPITVFGDGRQTRCFCSVGDVVRGLVDLPKEPRAIGQVVNVGSQEEIAINDLAQRVIERTGSKSTLKHIPYSEAYGEGFDDMERRKPDLSKAKDLIGWSPRESLNTIIDDIIASLRTAT